jgi:putative PLP-dependent aminotransferase (TIGR04422 family)
MIDYQWPLPFVKPSSYDSSLNEASCSDLYIEIESFFKDRFKVDPILVPSGRAAISLLIQYFNINRSNQVFTSLWSSHCLFNTIGAFSNPTVHFHENLDMIIINHKWGVTVRLKDSFDGILLEDSVDSIFLNKDTLFPNETSFEIISLPKVVGSYSGGILFSKNKSITNYIKDLQKKNHDLAKYQSRLKNKASRGEVNDFDSWVYNESWNTALDANALEDIRKMLPNYDHNKEIILQRLDIIKKRFGLELRDQKRIGPVFVFPISEYQDLSGSEISLRHFSFSESVENQQYEKVLVLPLHFGISDEMFNRLLNNIAVK